MGWRKKEKQLAEASQSYVMSSQLYVTWEVMEFSLAMKGLTPVGHMSSSDLIGQVGINGNGPQLSGCTKTWLDSSSEL